MCALRTGNANRLNSCRNARLSGTKITMDKFDPTRYKEIIIDLIFSKKMARAYALKDIEVLKRKMSSHPTLTLDHIIKERYPTFIDAIRDLDDCLSLCFLFGTFPSLNVRPHCFQKIGIKG